MTLVLQAVQASEQEALARVFAMDASADPIVIEKPNSTTVTVAQRVDVQAAAENGGFASIAVSGSMTDGDGAGETNRVWAAVPVSMIQQLAASDGTGVVLMVSASKASATEEIFMPGAATGPVAGAPADDAAPPTEPTLQITLAAQPVSVSVAVNGEIINIRNLREPILITVLSVKKDGFECAFYNETTLVWSSEEMWEHDAGNGALVCASTHLTAFAAIKKTWIGLQLAFTCIPAKFLTAEGLSSIIRRSPWRQVGAAAVYVLLLSQAWACFLRRACCGRKRSQRRHGVVFSHHFMADRVVVPQEWPRSLKIFYPAAHLVTEVLESVPKVLMAPAKTLRVHVAGGCILQRVAGDLGPTAPELRLILQWGQATRSRDEPSADNHLEMLKMVDRVQEQIDKQLDEDARNQLSFRRFIQLLRVVAITNS